MEHREFPFIDPLWGALESDDDLVTADETTLIHHRHVDYVYHETDVVDWGVVEQCLTARINRLPRSYTAS